MSYKLESRNNNLRYVDDTMLTAESEEELYSLLMRVKESERSGLKLYISCVPKFVSVRCRWAGLCSRCSPFILIWSH